MVLFGGSLFPQIGWGATFEKQMPSIFTRSAFITKPSLAFLFGETVDVPNHTVVPNTFFETHNPFQQFRIFGRDVIGGIFADTDGRAGKQPIVPAEYPFRITHGVVRIRRSFGKLFLGFVNLAAHKGIDDPSWGSPFIGNREMSLKVGVMNSSIMRRGRSLLMNACVFRVAISALCFAAFAATAV